VVGAVVPKRYEGGREDGREGEKEGERAGEWAQGQGTEREIR